jgi:hypothetical protein
VQFPTPGAIEQSSPCPPSGFADGLTEAKAGFAFNLTVSWVIVARAFRQDKRFGG